MNTDKDNQESTGRTAPENPGRVSLLNLQEGRINDYHPGLRFEERGMVHSAGDGIAWIKGLPSACMDEYITFSDEGAGLVFQLSPDRVGVVLLRQGKALGVGSEAFCSHRTISIGVGDALLGRVVDPLGQPLDNTPAPECTRHRELDVPSPPLLMRDFVTRPLYTGIKLVDTMIPIGRGQRQLIIGDNGVGKTSLALDTVLNQKDQRVRCVYVLIGQKKSTVVQVLETLRSRQALDYTTLVVAEAMSLPGLKYLAPFAGAAIAEEWMWDGHDTLVIYDDLSTHARTFRELSLLLRRPPGREAYPADIFFLHSRLLERATCLHRDQGGGSMTALPLVETKQGELATYIPTNLISITDGQIFLDQRLFSAGFLPAIDATRSVSRIGGKGQHSVIKEAAGQMKLDFLQFLELEVFTRFGSRLEGGVEEKLNKGRLLREILKQERLRTVPIEFQLAWMLAYSMGLLDRVPPQTVPRALERIQELTAESGLGLEDARETWELNLRKWLAPSEEQEYDQAPGNGSSAQDAE
ncbi:MAG: F0F1 ATP synthase subunit alpha [Deltaproteobacteria bacterium]|nr:F0F1 ATP synthase subunit alpha [Deltaproteobacteria bacterium]